MTLILPDTNILLWPFNDGPDIVEELLQLLPNSQIKIADCVLRELNLLTIPEAKAALSLFKTFPIHNLGKGDADDLLFNAAKRGAIIVTNDAELIKRIKDSKSPVVRPRGRYKLELIGRVGVQG